MVSKPGKTEQDKSALKILTLGRLQHKSQLPWNQVICAISESQMMEWTPKSECTLKIKHDRSILKILTFSQHLHKSQFFGNWMFAQFLSFE